jgi:hypothetical protein
MKLKKFLPVLIVVAGTAIGQSQDINDPFKDLYSVEKIAYTKGVKDTVNFFRLQAKAKLPDAGFWVVKDVSNRPLEEIAIFYLYGKQKGYSPVVVYNKASGRLYIVFISDKTLAEAQRDVNNLKPLKTYITPVKDPKGFEVATTYKVCRPKTVEPTVEGAIELVESAEAILFKNYADIIDKKKVDSDFKNAIRDLEIIKKRLINFKEALEEAGEY